ncbi:Protein transport protein sec39 [Schizosaccharomyces pombe]|uniref:Protein transport protein sec39 n=1 Tax=Schizosaccharomyces pombe (strain 972 / ATCC 24843) TaxID=284812 RepID=SEC39_SCHPO|nr:putative secretory pathway protein Sec39 [Schizosaccharomyces pombe]O14266.1 RecName: Full=Protein transport protein sec39 [Schizosaccharomyces pombe 972h-]CAB16728.1 secretory pathway protein Sec39 (predicted) [Schizosaccharomyces pombe]|eukprot:NP_593847.1 putative secretory pathway protein Sec39 [Schizosaccharomyces pombe]
MNEDKLESKWLFSLTESQKLYLLISLIINKKLPEAKFVYKLLDYTKGNWLSLLLRFLPETTDPECYIPYIDIDSHYGNIKASVNDIEPIVLPDEELCQLRLTNMKLWNCKLPSLKDEAEFYSLFSKKIVEETDLVDLAYQLTKNSQAPAEIQQWNSGTFTVFHKLSQFAAVPINLEEMEAATIRDVISLAFPVLDSKNCVFIMDEIITVFINNSSNDPNLISENWDFVWKKLLQLVKTDGLAVVHTLVLNWNTIEPKLFLKLAKVALASCYISDDSSLYSVSLARDITEAIQNKLNFSDVNFGDLLKKPHDFSADGLLSLQNDLTTPSSLSTSLLMEITKAIALLTQLKVPAPTFKTSVSISCSNFDSQIKYLENVLLNALGTIQSPDYKDWHDLYSYIERFKQLSLFFLNISEDAISVVFLKQMLQEKSFLALKQMRNEIGLKDIEPKVLIDCLKTSFYENFRAASNMNKNRGKLALACKVLDVFVDCEPTIDLRRRLNSLVNACSLIQPFKLILEPGKPLSPSLVEANLNPDKLIKTIFSQNPSAYTLYDDILALDIELHKAAGDFDYSQVFTELRRITEHMITLTIDVSLEKDDIEYAKQIVEDRLMTLAEASEDVKFFLYEIAYKIGKFPSNHPNAKVIRLDMLQIAIANAPRQKLDEVVSYWTDFQSNSKVLEENLNTTDVEFHSSKKIKDYEDLEDANFDEEWSKAADLMSDDPENQVLYEGNLNSSLSLNEDPSVSDENLTQKVTSKLTNGLGWVLGVPPRK